MVSTIGPELKARGVIMNKKQRTQNQIASTLVMMLGLEYKNSKSEVGEPMDWSAN